MARNHLPSAGGGVWGGINCEQKGLALKAPGFPPLFDEFFELTLVREISGFKHESDPSLNPVGGQFFAQPHPHRFIGRSVGFFEVSQLSSFLLAFGTPLPQRR